MRNPPCGCTREGYICEEHRARYWGDIVASDLVSIVALTLFVGTVLIWASVLG